jgi:ComF family protein
MLTASTWARKASDALVAVLLAPVCVACQGPLDAPSLGAVCGTCWQSVSPLSPPICESCADVLLSWRRLSAGETRCARCRRLKTAISRTAALGSYEGPLRAIVHVLKYGGRRSLAAQLGRMMRAHSGDVLRGADVAVPVPLHPVRWLFRGFNQAVDLARALGLPVVHALRRTRNTGSQADLPAAKRHANVRGAFRLARRTQVRGLCIVLVDDVSTTGATLEACARTLVAAGAREVRALIVARAVSLVRREPPLGPARPAVPRR